MLYTISQLVFEIFLVFFRFFIFLPTSTGKFLTEGPPGRTITHAHSNCKAICITLVGSSKILPTFLICVVDFFCWLLLNSSVFGSASHITTNRVAKVRPVFIYLSICSSPYIVHSWHLNIIFKSDLKCNRECLCIFKKLTENELFFFD